MKNVLYSKTLKDMFGICIIDGTTIKARGKNSDNLTEKEIAKAKENYEDILIQNGRIIEIFCSERKFSDFNNRAKTDKYLAQAYHDGFIKFNYREDN